MNFVAIHLHSFGDVEQLAVDAHFRKPLFLNLFKQFAVVTFSPFDFWREHDHFFPFIIFNDEVNDLIVRILYHRLACDIRRGRAHAREEQTHEVVDFGNGSNG